MIVIGAVIIILIFALAKSAKDRDENEPRP